MVPGFLSVKHQGVAVTDCSRAVYKTLEDSNRSTRQKPSDGPPSSNWVHPGLDLVSLGNPVCILRVETQGTWQSCVLKWGGPSLVARPSVSRGPATDR